MELHEYISKVEVDYGSIVRLLISIIVTQGDNIDHDNVLLSTDCYLGQRLVLNCGLTKCCQMLKNLGGIACLYSRDRKAFTPLAVITCRW